jgi:hypothetical protein
MHNIGDDSVSVDPDGSGNFNWLGVTVANATHAKPVYFKDSSTANAIDLDVQVAAARTGAPGDKNDAGLCSFDDTAFAVDADGYVTLVGGGGPALDSFTTDTAGPVVPNGSGVVDVTGTSVFSDGSVANTLTLNVQATANTFLVGAGAGSTVTELGPLTNGQLLVGSTGMAPVAASLTQPAAGITITGGAGTITFALADDLAGLEAITGTGIVSRTAADTYATSSITDGDVLIGGAGETVEGITLTNGQIVIGATGADPAAGSITSTDGSITITGGANTIDLSVAAADDAILTLTGDACGS